MNELHFTAVVGPDGVIHPPNGTTFPKGGLEISIKVRSNGSDTSDPLAQTRAWLLSFADEAEAAKPNLPPDLAANHDHYAHGAPKR